MYVIWGYPFKQINGKKLLIIADEVAALNQSLFTLDVLLRIRKTNKRLAHRQVPGKVVGVLNMAVQCYGQDQ